VLSRYPLAMRSSAVRSALAGVLVLAQLLMPFAHLPAAATTSGWTEICAGDGLRRVPTDGAPASLFHHSDHCALCRIASAMAGLPPGMPSLGGMPAVHEDPAPVRACLVGRSPQHDAQARAPPPAH
jgi:hypothetical protein